jgi:hypothetical protein
LPETGDHESGGETDAETPERHYRITLDFRLLLRPFTTEVCREGLFDDGSAFAGGPHSRENVERQRRLYDLLLSNERVLERYLLAVVAVEAGGFVFGGLAGAFGVAEDEELLEPLYAEMSEEDAVYFEESARAGGLWESTRLLGEAFEVKWVGAEFAEMNRRVVGDVSRAGGRRAGGHAPVKET